MSTTTPTGTTGLNPVPPAREPPADADRAARYQRHRAVPREVWPLLALALLLAFNFFFTPGFFDTEVRDGRLYGILIDIADRAAPVMLLAIGMTLVIATGGVDLSVGAVMAISGAVAAHLVAERQQPLWLALVAAIGAATLAGAWNGALVAYLRVQPIVATLILMVSGRGMAQLVGRREGQIIEVPPAEHPGFAMIGNGALFGLPFTLTLVAVALVIVALFTRRTAAGLFIEAVGNNRVASRFAGINERLVTVTVYALTGLCAGVAGLIAASDINASDANNAGLNLELDAILAVVLGGTALAGGRFYLVGAMIGALIIQTMTTTILTRNVPVAFTLVVKAVVVVAVCLIQAPRFREIMLGGVRRLAREGRRMKSLFRAKNIPVLATLLVCAALYTAAAIRYDHFFSAQVFIDFFRGEKNAALGIAAIGLTFVILAGGIDLSVGSVIACTGVVIATLAQRGWSPWIAMPLALVIGSAFGFAMGCLIHIFRLAPFLVTLAGLFLARGLASVISLTSLSMDHPTLVRLSEWTLPVGDSVIVPLAGLVFFGFAIVAVLVAAFTPFGRNVYAIGGDEQSAVLMGLPVGRTKIAIYTLSGFCSALAGVVYSVSLGSGDPGAAMAWELDAIAAVVIGGTLLTGGVGSLWGTVIGVLILAIIQTSLIFEGTISSWRARIIIGGLLLIFIALQKLLTRRTETAH